MGAEALCYGCHSHYGGTEDRRREVFSYQQLGVLLEVKNDLNRAREYKRAPMRELAKHYREEFKRMQALRDQGVAGRIEFAGFL